MKIVYVLWLDAEAQEDRWTDKDEATAACKAPLQPCATAGFLIYEDEDHLTVTHTDGGDCIGSHISIPRTTIIRWEVLR